MFPMTYERLLSIGVFLLVLTGYSSCFVPAAQARDPIPIVVTLPVLKDLTEQVGGPFVRVKSLLNGWNTVAEIPGSEKPEEVVIFSGHLDTWDGPGSKGTQDNGTGCAVMLEAARLLMVSGAKPKRTIRFALWTGEEQGLFGSEAYAKTHAAELPRISAVLNHDGGTNYLSGLPVTAEIKAQLEGPLAVLTTLDPAMPFEFKVMDGLTPVGSDSDVFIPLDVPGMFWEQAGRSDYEHYHHTQHDVLEAAIPEYQRHSAVVIATGALGLANLPELLTRENMKVNRGFGGGGAYIAAHVIPSTNHAALARGIAACRRAGAVPARDGSDAAGQAADRIPPSPAGRGD